MATKYRQDYPIPNGFPDILHDFTREILRENPEDALLFAVEYFQALKSGQDFQYSKHGEAKTTQEPSRLVDQRKSSAVSNLSLESQSAKEYLDGLVSKVFENLEEYRRQSNDLSERDSL